MLSRYMHLANFLQEKSKVEIMVGIGYLYNFYCYVQIDSWTWCM